MAKCKNCTKCLMGEAVFIHGARVYPFCGVDGEEVENLDEDKECIDFECMTNADRIRSMTDDELANFLYRFNDIDEKVKFCTNKKVCIDLLDKGDTLHDEWCKDCLLEWLRSEVGE